jgi:hypothetical protein
LVAELAAGAEALLSDERRRRLAVELCTAQWRPSTGWSTPLPGWDGPGTLVLAFGAAELADRPDPLAELRATYPRAHVVGCSTAGEIFADTVVDDSLTVAVVRFAHTRMRVVSAPVVDASDSYHTGLSLAKQLSEEDPELAGIFVLSDGLAVNGSSLVAGLSAGAGPDVIITGGLAGDGDRFARTWVLADGEPRTGRVTAVGLAGRRLRIGHGSQGGWDLLGPKRRVTRSDANVVHELDGQPALELYKKYLGDRAAGLPATALLFPLAVWTPGAEDRKVVRTILAVDEDAQSLTFAGDVPPGSTAQLMRASLDRLVEGAEQSAAAAAGGPGGPRLTVAISCVGRRLILAGRAEDELEAVVSGSGPGADLVGFYSYGEIAPVVANTCDLQNQTMTVTTYTEGDD